MLNSAKIRYAGIFAIIAKITMYSKNFNFRYAQLFSLCQRNFAIIANFLYDSENHCA